MDIDLLLYCSMKYALGKTSSIVDSVAHEIKLNLNKLHEGTREKMKEDINEAIKTGKAGMPIDVYVWQTLLDKL